MFLYMSVALDRVYALVAISIKISLLTKLKYPLVLSDEKCKSSAAGKVFPMTKDV